MYQQQCFAGEAAVEFIEGCLVAAFVCIVGAGNGYFFFAKLFHRQPIPFRRPFACPVVVVFDTYARREGVGRFEGHFAVLRIIEVVGGLAVGVYVFGGVGYQVGDYRHCRLIRLHVHRIYRIPFRYLDIEGDIRLVGGREGCAPGNGGCGRGGSAVCRRR